MVECKLVLDKADYYRGMVPHSCRRYTGGSQEEDSNVLAAVAGGSNKSKSKHM